MLKPSWMVLAFHSPPPLRPGFFHHARRLANHDTDTTSGYPSPSTSTGRSLKLSMYCEANSISRNRCGVHEGASYQNSPEMTSRRVSRFTSATAAVSLAPPSMARAWNGTSAGLGASADGTRSDTKATKITKITTYFVVFVIFVAFVSERSRRPSRSLMAQAYDETPAAREPRSRVTRSR